jgi:hypothetical protein
VVDEADYSVPDSLGKTRKHKTMAGFTDKVLELHNYTCVVCGTSFSDLVDAA